MSTGNKELDRNVKTFKKYRNLLKELTAKNVKHTVENAYGNYTYTQIFRKTAF